MPDFYEIWAILGSQGPERRETVVQGLSEAREKANELMAESQTTLEPWFAVGVRPTGPTRTAWSYLNSVGCGPDEKPKPKKKLKAEPGLPMRDNPIGE